MRNEELIAFLQSKLSGKVINIITHVKNEFLARPL